MPVLRVDPRERNRLAAIIANLRDRIIEARVNQWVGEVQGLGSASSSHSALHLQHSLSTATQNRSADGVIGGSGAESVNRRRWW